LPFGSSSLQTIIVTDPMAQPPSPADCSHKDSTAMFRFLVEQLRGGGMRMTASRRALLKVLIANRRPLSLEELTAAARAYGCDPDYTTVFRLMCVLEKLGLVNRLNLHHSISQYELIDPEHHHDHIVCTQCGKVTVIENHCPLVDLEAEIARTYGFHHLSHQLEFRGVCADCETHPNEHSSR